MNDFWAEFNRLYFDPLEALRVELNDALAAWDEIPDVSGEFVEHMDEAYVYICKAIGEMRLAQRGRAK